MGNHQHSHSHKHQDNKCNHSNQKTQTLTQQSQQNNPKTSILHYGGKVMIDKTKKVVVQQFQIQVQEFPTFMNMIQIRKKFNHPNLITLKSYHIQDQATGCLPTISQPINIRLQYEPIMHSLQAQIKCYCAKKMPVKQTQVRRIFFQVVSCLQFLQNNQCFHGDIKPSTILFNKDKQVKLIDSYLVNIGKTAFQIVLQNQKSESYLTPEQLQLSKHKRYQSLKNVNKSDIFCVGMCMVELMTFQSSMQAYDLMQMALKPQFFQRKLKEMKQYGYSFLLADLSLRCLHKDSHKRPTFSQFLQQIIL